MLDDMGISQSEFGFPITKHELNYLNANLELVKRGVITKTKLSGWMRAVKGDVLASFENVPDLKYVNGEKHLLWGEEYTLQLIANNIKTAFVNENTLYLPVSKRSKIKNRQKTLEDFYRAELKKELEKEGF